MKVLPYILNLLGLSCFIGASLIKGKKMGAILLLSCLGNLLIGTGYMLNDGFNGAVSSFIGTVVTMINFLYERNDKKVPGWLTGIYAVAFIICNLLADFSIYCLPAVGATVAYVCCIGQKNGARYRIFNAMNSVLWCVYDVMTATYSSLIVHIVLLLFTLVGMMIHDRKKA